MGGWTGEPRPSRTYVIQYNFNELLINIAALMEHHSRQLLKSEEAKPESTIEDKIKAANYIVACEKIVLRIQAIIRDEEFYV